MKKISLTLALLLTALLITGCKNAEKITEEKAKSIALEHAGITTELAESLVILEDYDDGRQYYDVHFHYNGYEYDYEINAKNGKITDYDKEYEPRTGKTPAADVATGTETAGITEEDAKSIALEHAGITDQDVTGLRVSLDSDDGRSHYDVSFRKDGYEYDYEIHPETGAILDFDKDYDD